MTEQQLSLSFSYEEGRFPAYSNAVLVNQIIDGAFLLDFGFVDPFAVLESNGKVQPTSRIVITRDTAEQLTQMLSLFLSTNIVKENIPES